MIDLMIRLDKAVSPHIEKYQQGEKPVMNAGSTE
jgi:hypothetical protein